MINGQHNTYNGKRSTFNLDENGVQTFILIWDPAGFLYNYQNNKMFNIWFNYRMNEHWNN